MRFVIEKRGSIFSFLSLTTWLIIINVVLFFAFAIISIFRKDFIGLIALQPSYILHGERLWTIFTSMFMHANAVHLVVNMITLFFLGRFSEKIIGKKRFFWLYIISGIVGALAFVGFAYLGTYFSWGENVFGAVSDSAVGASGALFGLLGLLAVLIPFYSIYLIAGPLILIVLEIIVGNSLPESISGIFYVASSILMFVMIFAIFSPSPRFRRLAVPIKMSLWFAPIAAIVPLVAISFFAKLPIGNTAHFGGLVAGLVYAFYLRSKYKKKIILLRRYFR